MFVLIMYGPAEALPKTKCPEFLDQLPNIVHLQFAIIHITYPLLLVQIGLLLLFHRTKSCKYSIGIRSRNYIINPYQSPMSWLVSPCLTPFLMGQKSGWSNLRSPSISGPWELRPRSTSEVTGSPGQGRGKFILMGKVSCKLY